VHVFEDAIVVRIGNVEVVGRVGRKLLRRAEPAHAMRQTPADEVRLPDHLVGGYIAGAGFAA
jgi:hypothetical protein